MKAEITTKRINTKWHGYIGPTSMRPRYRKKLFVEGWSNFENASGCATPRAAVTGVS
jgi:hypothetical protein